ncbi:IS200/IS605 family transposase [Limnospira platensis]|uniref:IS200/IS605 family transposase n=1 Tax=Limnospira platensis TaxID=118562 RepID=UPI0001D0EA34|nr:transposase [Arthrospira platensis str. Paraca]MDF2213121.1 IS200/IS605 family transposase [Arthrospira platensis NCB002]QQW27115.1 IS200/IS605 family transposase [Arthrospira sp. PCC 9108]BAI91453.1 transposase [Arthrospira platensis NIES-39]BDT13755.1 transposase [Arthrospira platensis NIES-39]
MRNKSINYRHGNHSVGLAHVHLVWIPKRRKKVLVSNVKLRLAAILNEVARENEWRLKALEIAPDHVHVLVEHGSQVAIHQIVKAMKVRSSRLLRQEFPHLCKLPSLWTRAYFYDTTGKVSTARIMAYINDPHHT